MQESIVHAAYGWLALAGLLMTCREPKRTATVFCALVVAAFAMR